MLKIILNLVEYSSKRTALKTLHKIITYNLNSEALL